MPCMKVNMLVSVEANLQLAQVSRDVHEIEMNGFPCYFFPADNAV